MTHELQMGSNPYSFYLYENFDGICVRLSPEGSIVYGLVMSEDTMIPHAVNYVLLFIYQYHHLGD